MITEITETVIKQGLDGEETTVDSVAEDIKEHYFHGNSWKMSRSIVHTMKRVITCASFGASILVFVGVCLHKLNSGNYNAAGTMFLGLFLIFGMLTVSGALIIRGYRETLDTYQFMAAWEERNKPKQDSVEIVTERQISTVTVTQVTEEVMIQDNFEK